MKNDMLFMPFFTSPTLLCLVTVIHPSREINVHYLMSEKTIWLDIDECAAIFSRAAGDSTRVQYLAILPSHSSNNSIYHSDFSSI